MTIKELAHSAQKQLQSSTTVAIKRTHVYELLSAAFGVDSWAAFGFTAVLTTPKYPPLDYQVDTASIRKRGLELGYPTDVATKASSELAIILKSLNVCVIGITRLLDRLRGLSLAGTDHQPPSVTLDTLGDEWYATESLASPLLMECLQASASKDVADAHYALALLHATDEYEDDASAGSDYWYNQAQQGRLLTGVEKEWADAYAARLESDKTYEHHLREAARLGSPHALFDLATHYEEPDFFERDITAVNADPSEIAEIAFSLGREEDGKRWLTKAAESGDINAMRELIEGPDANDLQRCWTWIYLAELHGTDLTEDNHYAINEDGSRYDWEVGGNAFVGGEDGMDLPALPDSEDKAARSAAEALFNRVPS